MGKKKSYTITEIAQEPSLLYKAVPFDVVRYNRVIATVTKPQGQWYQCENCGENTRNIIEFKDEHYRWHKLILCDKCGEELL